MAAAIKDGPARSRLDILKARNFIQERSAQDLTLTAVAKVANLNPTYFSEKFKQVTGTRFVEYLTRIRFKNACDLLRKSDLEIRKIALDVGFQSLSQFNRVFKKFSGTSAREYRAAYRH